MPSLEGIVARYLRRAAELRAIAESVQDEANRDALVSWAETYEVVAERAVKNMQWRDSSAPQRLLQESLSRKPS